MHEPKAGLIVNADDFGYYPWVNEGILQLASAGTVTAAGVLANGVDLPFWLARLRRETQADVGVHLNLTSGRPLTAALAARLAARGGEFPGIAGLAGLVLRGGLSLALIRQEWRAQIETVRAGGEIRFLNSHQHIHMWPPLFGLSLELAREFKAPHVRVSQAGPLLPANLAGCLRGGALQALAWLNGREALGGQSPLLGLNQSGRLDAAYLRRLLPRLRPGRVYELMCHPGLAAEAEVPPRIAAYHAWAREFELLRGPEFAALLREQGVELTYFRESIR